MEKDKLVKTIEEHANNMRRTALKMTSSAGSAHVGPALSAMEICAALYFGVMNHDPGNPCLTNRDRFILSKGHGVLALYAALFECGYMDEQTIFTFEKADTHLAGHPCANGVPGIEFPTGSMGHGLSVGCGMALACRITKNPYNVYVVTGDGELDEGSNWEAIMFAAQNKLSNLCAIVDANGYQHDSLCRNVMEIKDIAGVFRAFGWNAMEVNGHDVKALLDAFDTIDRKNEKPTVIVAHTIKGKGVSFMENNNAWHSSAISPEQFAQAIQELA